MRSTVSCLFFVLCLCFNSQAGETSPPPKPAPEKPAPEKKPDDAKAQIAQQPPLVVTASRLPTPMDETGVSITVLDGRTDREVHQNISLAEALRQVPGVIISQSGQQGDFTTIFIRGGESNHTLMLYDGWKVSRQGGRFDFSGLDPVQLDRAEIARGPASSLFGTNAVTGTVNVITAQGEGNPEVKVSGAGGTYGTDRETLAVQGRHKKFSYNVGSSRLHRDEATYNNSELELYNYAARFDFEINKNHALKAIVRGTDLHKGFYEDTGSGYGPTVEPADPNDQIKTRDVLTGLEYKGTILPIWTTTLRLGHYLFDTRIISDAPNPVSAVAGFAQSTGRTFTQERRPSLDWQNDITAFESEDKKIRNIVTIGTNIEQERFNQDDTQFGTNINVQHTNWSVFLQNRLELFERAFITTAIRREENGQFGDFTTARADVSLLIPESDTRIHGAVGNAFRAPSFFEFFSAFGNPALQPEENFAYDVGIEQFFWKKRIMVGATWFHNQFESLVSFDFANSTFENLREAETRGFELRAEIRPIECVTLRGSATLMHTEDANGRRLLRRPHDTYTAQVIAHPLKGLDLSLDLLRVGVRSDIGPADGNAFATVRNDSYIRMDAAASYRFFDHWRAFGRVENFLNKSYEDVRTFASPGTHILAGIEFAWRF